jgi:hypothetical protein
MRRGRCSTVLALGFVASGLLPVSAAPQAPPALNLNQIQMVGTAASAKQPPGDAMLSLIRMGGKHDAEALNFGEPSLTAQLDAGARVLSFDIAYDPKGGLFKDPAGASMADELLDDTYVTAMSQPGFKVIHVLDIDYKSGCMTLKACLGEVSAWSAAHPRHIPIVIALHVNASKTPMPGATRPLPFDATAANALDTEIQDLFAAGKLITPDQIKAQHASLREAVQAGDWPTLTEARGKLLFVLADDAKKTALYAGMPGHIGFVTADEASPDAGFVAIDDPLKDGARITADVKAGFMVMTLADNETTEARANDAKRRDAAFASGAQIILTDFLLPDKKIGPYQVTITDRRHVQCDALIADCSAWIATAPGAQRTAVAR